MTIREDLLTALVSHLNASQALQALATAERAHGVAYEGSTFPVVLVTRGKEVPDYNQYGVVYRDLEVLVSALSTTSEAAADAIQEIVHPLVMSFSANNVVEVSEGETDEPTDVGASTTANAITTHYHIKYRAQANSLSN